jgi:hypothetical protein
LTRYRLAENRHRLAAARIAAALLLSLSWGMASPPASAHKASDAYVTLTDDARDEQRLQGQWDIALRDLDHALVLDADGDGAITWGEVRARHPDIAAYALSHLAIKSDGLACPLTAGRQMIDEHSDGAYSVLYFTVDCDKEVPNELTVDYDLLFALDPSHRGILTVHHDGTTANAVLSPAAPSMALSLNAPDRWRQFKSFVVDGVWHIWTGYDHLLFLASLLLPAVLIRRRGAPPRPGPPVRPEAPRRPGAPARPEASLPAGSGARWRRQTGAVSLTPAGSRALDRVSAARWEPAPSLWRAFVDVFKIISGFTVSHTCTLTLAVLGIVTLPDRLVESGIALSVVLAAANNLYPLVHRRLWLVAFGFGFIHGLGFASALAGLRLPPAAMAASLGGFNVGVEIGQEAIVIALMPLAYLLRRSRFYRVVVLKAGSAVIVLIAAVWFFERAF